MVLNYEDILSKWEEQKPIRAGKTYWCAIAEAIEKQVSKAPFRLIKHKDFFNWECPKCHMTYGCCTVKVNYCYECGQAIKWG